MRLSTKNISRMACYFMGWNKENYKNAMLLLIACMHHHKVITYDKMIGLFQSLKSSDWKYHRKLYHNNINNTWYEDSNMIDILLECCPKHLSIDVLVFIKEYVQLYLNVPYNYAVDFVYSIYFNSAEYNLSQEDFTSFLKDCDAVMFNDVFSYEEVAHRYELSDGYCCSDCDGCLGEYKRGRYESRFGHSKEMLLNRVKKYFKSIRKPNPYRKGTMAHNHLMD